MLLKEIEPFVRKALIGAIKSNNEADAFRVLKTRDCRLLYILTDRGAIVIGGKPFKLRYGMAILFQSGTEYLWQPEGQNEIRFIAVNFDYTQNFTNVRNSQHPIHAERFPQYGAFENIVFEDAVILNDPIVIENLPSLESRMRMIASEFYLGDDYCGELLTSVLKSLIISIVRIYSHDHALKKNTKDLQLASEMIAFIQTHYAENISYELLANTFYLNPVYLNRVFKARTNMSIHAFVLNYRLNIAMTMLRSESTSVQEIARMVGYQDPVHFHKIFKKYTGMTPSQFRFHDEEHHDAS